VTVAVLPDGYSAGAPTADDAEAVAGLIAACQLAFGDRSGMTVEELLGDWQELDLSEEAVAVAAPDGSLAAYADVLNRSYVSVSVYGYVHPEHRARGLGAFLVGWGEEWARERMDIAPEGARVVVQHYVHTADEPAQRLLRDLDYAPVRGYYRMSVELEQAPPRPEWPEHTTVRAFELGRDERPAYEVVEDAFRDVWGRPQGTFDRFLGFTHVESFDPGLWFLAESGGEISGVCLCKTVADRGEVDVVGVRCPWRGRGLGLALLRHALGEFYRRGVREVGLSVDAESATGAPRLYGRAGMQVEESYVLYQKELRPGRDVSEVHRV
jgi:mycothiol synthase